MRSSITLGLPLSLLAILACSTAPDEGNDQERSALRSDPICHERARMLQPGAQTIAQPALMELAPVPDCGSGRSARTAVYRFSVPEPGSVKMDPIDTHGRGWTLQAFRGTQCYPGSAGQWIGCEAHSASGYTTPYRNYGNEQYAVPNDDLIIGVAGINGAELVNHELKLTFEPSCGNGRPEDNARGGLRSWEECEDGGRAAGDGCSASCSIESACVLTVPRIAGEAPAVIDVPPQCRTARVKGNVPWQKTVVARINSTNDTSVIASVRSIEGNVRYRKPRPSNSDDPWVTIAVGPKLPERTTWECGLSPEERCAETQCTSENSVCRVRYANPGSKTYVRIANATVRGSVAVDVRIDRNLENIYASP